MIVPILQWNLIAENALRFAITLSCEIEVLHIESEDSPNSLKQIWPSCVEQPAREAKQAIPRLTVLKSPFRFVVQPILDHVLEIEREQPRSYHRGAAAGARRAPMVPIFSSQPARPNSRGSFAAAGRAPNRDRQCALVSAQTAVKAPQFSGLSATPALPQESDDSAEESEIVSTTSSKITVSTFSRETSIAHRL